jgi:hypothetical protein
MIETSRPIPYETTIQENGIVVDDIRKLVVEYQSNGYDRKQVELTSYYMSQLRREHGLPRADDENWFDAELFSALAAHGCFWDEGEIIFRRKILSPHRRGRDHFTKGDALKVYVPSTIKNPKIITPGFIDASASCVHNGKVYFVTKREWFEEKSPGGRSGVAELKNPLILLKEEFDYLRVHNNQLKIWLDSIDEPLSEELIEFKTAILNINP